MLIDLHADTPLWQHWMGYDFCRQHRPWLPAGSLLCNIDLPRMKAVNMTCQMFGLVALPWEHDGFYTVQRMIERLRDAAARSDGGFTLVRDRAALEQAAAKPVCTGLLSIEGVHALRGRLERADWLIDQGVVSFGLCHFHANEACFPAQGFGRQDRHGLTAFGQRLVHHLQARRAIIDLTHINRRGFFEVLDQAPEARVMVSHTGVQGAHSHWRNLDDAQIRAVADRGGIMGVIFSRHYLGGDDMQAVVRHMLHLHRVGGAECVALGSDFDGFIVPVRGLRDITGLPALAALLRRSGLAAQEVDGVMGQNAWRFLRGALPAGSNNALGASTSAALSI